jgi:anti-anti-sigma factor
MMIERVDERVEPAPATQTLGLQQFSMRSTREGDVHAIALVGELDIANADLVQCELERVEASDVVAIVLDLSGLTFMDSTGVRLMICAAARSRADSDRLVVLRGQPAVQRVFELCGVVELLPLAE